MMTFYRPVKNFGVFNKVYLIKVWFLLILGMIFITPESLTHGEEMKIKKTIAIAEFDLPNSIKEEITSATLNDMLLRVAMKSGRFKVNMLNNYLNRVTEQLIIELKKGHLSKETSAKLRETEDPPDLLLLPTVSYITTKYQLTASLLDLETCKVIDVFKASSLDIVPLITSLWEHLDPPINEKIGTSGLPTKIRVGTFWPILRTKGFFKDPFFSNPFIFEPPLFIYDQMQRVLTADEQKTSDEIKALISKIESTHSQGAFDDTQFSLDRLLMICTNVPTFKPKEELLFYVWYNTGVNCSMAALGHENYEKEIYYYDKAIQADKSKREAWVSKGVALAKQNLFSKAIECYDKAIKIIPKGVYVCDDIGYVWYNMGNALFVLSRFAEAIECYDKSISIDHGDHESLKNKGVALEKVGRYDEANSIWAIFPKD